MKTSCWTVSCLLLLALTCSAQMDKRSLHRYEPSAFERAAPALGAPLPPARFTDVDGRTWDLSELKGNTVVLIGGGYT